MQHESGRGQILGCLISNHLEFQVVRVRIGSDFGQSDLGSSRVFDSFGFESGRVLGCVISDHLRFFSSSGSDWVGFRVV
jgi:hypothetical protein